MTKLRHRFVASAIAALSAAAIVLCSDARISGAGDTISTANFAFDPVTIEPPSAGVRLTRLGSYRGGWFSNNTPTSAVYDRRTERLFVGSVDRQAIEAIDISDPNLPRRVFSIPLAPFGDEPNDIAIHKGVLAVTVETSGSPTEPNRILFFNADGESLAASIELAGVSRLEFAPNGRRLVATVSGGFDEETFEFTESKFAVIDLGRVNWGGCRKGPRPVASTRPCSWPTSGVSTRRTSGRRVCASSCLRCSRPCWRPAWT